MRKLNIADWGFIISTIVFILIFPISNAYIAGGIDLVMTQISLIGSAFIQVPATIMGLYIAYQVYGFVQKDNKLNIPKKTAKTTKAGKLIDTK